ncbi:MAG: hypothetical protein RBS57_21155 [Desulforhabdus sp.]|jgi:MoaA/NifB/PqqE/SkfB family radical SAM enzyme|nr:hypothetical protein [Desulforhabdus sp.]
MKKSSQGRGLRLRHALAQSVIQSRRSAQTWYFSRKIIRVQNVESDEWEEVWTGDYVFENEWQSFRTKKDRSLELLSIFHECLPGRRKLAVKVVDIFGNDTMKIVEVNI